MSRPRLSHAAAASRREAGTLTALALCEELSGAIRLWRALGELDGVELRLLVSNNRRRPGLRFLLERALELRRLGPSDSLLVVRLLARGVLRIDPRSLESEGCRRWLRRRRFDVGLHATSLIYRRPVLDLFRIGVLNPHIGVLPRYRGRSVMEWSLLNGDETGVTTFLVDAGIDTGRLIADRRAVPVDGFATVAAAKSHLFSLDVEVFAAALRRLAASEGPQALDSQPSEGTRWYVMSELLTGVVDSLLRDAAGRRSASGSPPLV